MLSRHTHFIKLNDGRYAVFNNMVMDIIYVDKAEKEQIISQTLSDPETIDILFDKGIYVQDDNADEKALEILRNTYRISLGKIQILYLILTNSCNLNCSYCFLENNPQYKEHRVLMSERIAMLAVEKFCAYINENSIVSPLIILYGGEPLINFEVIKKIIRYVNSNIEKPYFSLITNGTLLNDEICTFLKANNVNVGISIDGTKVLHDKNRPFRSDGKGSFDATNNGRLLLKQHGNNYGLSMTVSPQFLDYQDEVIEWLSLENEVNIFYTYIIFQFLIAHGRIPQSVQLSLFQNHMISLEVRYLLRDGFNVKLIV